MSLIIQKSSPLVIDALHYVVPHKLGVKITPRDKSPNIRATKQQGSTLEPLNNNQGSETRTGGLRYMQPKLRKVGFTAPPFPLFM